MRWYGLIGKPLKHSFSQSYFTRKFAAEGVTDATYQNFELESIGQLPLLLQQQPLLHGLNVTIPYKKEVISFLTAADKVVEEIGACNCIKISGKQLHGFNTDVVGFQKSLQPLLLPHHQKALVLGTGGSSNAVQYALRQMGITYTLVSRQKNAGTITYAEIDKRVLKSFTVIINTTPVGMFPHVDVAPDIPYPLLTPDHLLYDLIYNPEKTLFLQRGDAQGAAIKNGYEMLLLQAEESWAIWNR